MTCVTLCQANLTLHNSISHLLTLHNSRRPARISTIGVVLIILWWCSHYEWGEHLFGEHMYAHTQVHKHKHTITIARTRACAARPAPYIPIYCFSMDTLLEKKGKKRWVVNSRVVHRVGCVLWVVWVCCGQPNVCEGVSPSVSAGVLVVCFPPTFHLYRRLVAVSHCFSRHHV